MIDREQQHWIAYERYREAGYIERDEHTEPMSNRMSAVQIGNRACMYEQICFQIKNVGEQMCTNAVGSRASEGKAESALCCWH